MKLRFEVNQAESFRLGVDSPKSIVTVDVQPAELDPNVRAIIAKRLSGIDVCSLGEDGKPTGTRLTASLPTFDELIVAVEIDEARISGKAASHPPIEERMKAAKAKEEASRNAFLDAVRRQS